MALFKMEEPKIPVEFIGSSTEHKIIQNIYNEKRYCADCIAALFFTGSVSIEIKMPKEVRGYHENIFLTFKYTESRHTNSM